MPENIRLQEEFIQEIKKDIATGVATKEKKLSDYIYHRLSETDDVGKLYYQILMDELDPEMEHMYQILTNIRDGINNRENSKMSCIHRPGFLKIMSFPTLEDAENAVKMYIPLDEEHLERGSLELLKFLEQENIAHKSKIREVITPDNIVLRVRSLEDARKIAAFVKGNSYLQEGLQTVNPFLISKDKIGYAYDGKRSYNATVAETIASYFQKLQAEGQQNKASQAGLVTYVKEQLKKDSYDEDQKNILKLLNIALVGSNKYEEYEEFMCTLFPDKNHRLTTNNKKEKTPIEPLEQSIKQPEKKGKEIIDTQKIDTQLQYQEVKGVGRLIQGRIGLLENTLNFSITETVHIEKQDYANLKKLSRYHEEAVICQELSYLFDEDLKQVYQQELSYSHLTPRAIIAKMLLLERELKTNQDERRQIINKTTLGLLGTALDELNDPKNTDFNVSKNFSKEMHQLKEDIKNNALTDPDNNTQSFDSRKMKVVYESFRDNNMATPQDLAVLSFIEGNSNNNIK